MPSFLNTRSGSPQVVSWPLLKEISDGVAVFSRSQGGITKSNPAFTKIAAARGLDDKTPDSRWSQLLTSVGIELEDGKLLWRSISADNDEQVRVGILAVEDNPDLCLLLLPATTAEPDIVTGLADRRVLEAEIEKRYHSGHEFTLLFVDLDGFKQVNDSLGHPSGDQALREIAQRISAGLRDVDLVGRYGGDEFVILLEGVVREDDLTPILDRVRDAASQPLDSIPGGGNLSASIGWAVSTQGYESPAAMLAAADRCMYVNKRQGC